MGELSAIVLAGGRATRLGGANKALLEIGGSSILNRVLKALRPLADQIVVVGHLADGVRTPGVRIVPDLRPQGGTLVGIYSGMVATQADASLAVACDMPFLSTPLLSKLTEWSAGYDVCVPRIGPHLEAMHAVYRRSCLPVMERAIYEGDLKIINFYPKVKTREVPEHDLRTLDPDLRSFMNVNTREDLELARRLARGPAASG